MKENNNEYIEVKNNYMSFRKFALTFVSICSSICFSIFLLFAYVEYKNSSNLNDGDLIYNDVDLVIYNSSIAHYYIDNGSFNVSKIVNSLKLNNSYSAWYSSSERNKVSYYFEITYDLFPNMRFAIQFFNITSMDYVYYGLSPEAIADSIIISIGYGALNWHLYYNMSFGSMISNIVNGIAYFNNSLDTISISLDDFKFIHDSYTYSVPIVKKTYI